MTETQLGQVESKLLTDISLRRLDPESPQDLAVARVLDTQSLEAISAFAHEHPEPDASPHALMPDGELKRWMSDRSTAMLRVIELPKDGRKEKRPVGFVYLYDDSKDDPDFLARAQELRDKLGLPADRPVWEMNFWVEEGTDDGVVKEAVRQTLTEFAGGRGQDTATVMFVDAGDLKDAYEKESGGPVTLRDLQKGETKMAAEDAFQDTRVLKGIGFEAAGRMAYEPKAPVKDFVYSMNIRPGQVL